jgi:hypothetical protein
MGERQGAGFSLGIFLVSALVSKVGKIKTRRVSFFVPLVSPLVSEDRETKKVIGAATQCTP